MAGQTSFSFFRPDLSSPTGKCRFDMATVSLSSPGRASASAGALVAQPDRLHAVFGLGPVNVARPEDQTTAGGGPPLHDRAHLGVWILNDVIFAGERGARKQQPGSDNELLHGASPRVDHKNKNSK
jgi:hypothetical protein